MECLNLRFVRIGSKNTVRTARTPHRAITAEGVCLHSVKWADQYQIGADHFTEELVLTEGEIVRRNSRPTVRYYYWWLSTKFWSIYQLQQRVLRPFTVIFHARV